MESEEQKKIRINKELKIIKENYGEEFSKFCRSKFQIILNYPGVLPKILLSRFAPNKFLLSDIKNNYFWDENVNEFITYINSEAVAIIGHDIFAHEIKDTGKGVKELLEEAGYEFYECTTDGKNPESTSDIQYFKKYYRTSEVVCTIKNGGRLNKCHVFWIVKKDYDKIEPSENPKREDSYSTSVLSIQFDRATSTVEIISRYNHTVTSPNSTYNNDLEEICPGLTKAFEKDYGLKAAKKKQPENIIQQILNNYIRDNTGKYHKINYYINGIAYCINNTIIDENKNAIVLDKSRYILIDYFIFDKLERKIYPFDSSIKDPFLDAFSDLSETRMDENNKERKAKIIDELDKETRIRTIRIKQIGKKDIIFKVDEKGTLVSYDNKNLTTIGDYFLKYSTGLEKINIANGTKIDKFEQNSNLVRLLNSDYVYDKNGKIYKLNSRINGITYCNDNTIIDKEGNVIVLDKNRYILIDYFVFDKQEKKMYPYDSSIKDSFPDTLEILNREENINITETIDERTGIKTIIISQQGKEDIIIKINDNGQIISYDNKNIKIIGDNFLVRNKALERLNLPNVEIVGNNFCNGKTELLALDLPKVKTIGDRFCRNCLNLSTISFPCVETIGDEFCESCSRLTDLVIPNVRTIGDDFCNYCSSLTNISLPNVLKIGNNFCEKCESLTSTVFPSVEVIGGGFCNECKSLMTINLPKVREIGKYFCEDCESLVSISMQSIETIDNNFLEYCKTLKTIDLPSVKKIGENFCRYCSCLTKVNLPNLETVGDRFCYECSELKTLILPKLKIIGREFCESCIKLTDLVIPNARIIGDDFCNYCSSLTNISLPNAEEIGRYFCNRCESLTEINIPKVKNISSGFCNYCNSLIKVVFPNAETIGEYACYGCNSLKLVSAPKAKTIHSAFCKDCKSLTEIDLPNVERIGNKFLYNTFSSENKPLRIILPRLKSTGSEFLYGRKISELYIPQTTIIASMDTFYLNMTLRKLSAPKLIDRTLKEELENIAKGNNSTRISRIINLKIYKEIEKIQLIKSKIELKIKKGDQNEEVRNNRNR